MSMSGTATTMSGSTIGMKAGMRSRSDTTSGSIWPVTMIAAAAIVRPSTMDPESPIKMRAGCMLCGRKPIHAPTSTARMRVARDE